MINKNNHFFITCDDETIKLRKFEQKQACNEVEGGKRVIGTVKPEALCVPQRELSRFGFASEKEETQANKQKKTFCILFITNSNLIV